ncbi:SDR family NAD(P)-dependent oxidoreductase [Gordonia humi]|uniref:3-oxoacyl-[acyl-carrier-protein] reductase MabA n=1 Tax=Gordonia humi TaxID=686429 RepID=A0A840ERU2_9ACTN|nr:SDR family NAD(P)-dependent oxidoreductase [Gordonia humi]MBB4134271.1 NAD(P)-dependent dehydrogenase (short-subunit alcohol dehydrogenase family) [Gordonia humi]
MADDRAREGRVALVTGGTEGIGRAIATALLDDGAHVAVTGRRAEKGARMLAALDVGDRLHFIESDALADGEPGRVARLVADRLGPIEILVNNVGGGTGEYGRIDTISPDSYRRGFELNVMTSVEATHAVLPQMIERGWGRILMVASLEGKLPTLPGVGPYVTAKHALIGLAKSIAFDVGEFGITCNTLCPGYVDIPTRVRSQSASAGRANSGRYADPQTNYKLLTRTGRHATLDEVAHGAMSLLAESAGAITGTTLNVDGGSSPF